jgi:hypothetical protein
VANFRHWRFQNRCPWAAFLRCGWRFIAAPRRFGQGVANLAINLAHIVRAEMWQPLRREGTANMRARTPANVAVHSRSTSPASSSAPRVAAFCSSALSAIAAASLERSLAAWGGDACPSLAGNGPPLIFHDATDALFQLERVPPGLHDNALARQLADKALGYAKPAGEHFGGYGVVGHRSSNGTSTDHLPQNASSTTPFPKCEAGFAFAALADGRVLQNTEGF